MALPAILDSSDPATKSFVIRVMAVTLAVCMILALAASLWLAIIGRSVPAWLPGLVTFVLGGGVWGMGSHTGASTAIEATAAGSSTPTPPAGPPAMRP